MIHGALLGDFVKGPLVGDYDAATERGILLHRQIDGFSNRDTQLRELTRQLPPELQRYGGIIIDVVFDHFLSLHWSRFHPEALETFTAGIYAAIEPHHRQWPPPARRFSERLVEYDILGQYHDWSTVERVFVTIGKRLSRDNPMPSAAAAVAPELATMEAIFLDFYPRVLAHAAELRQANPQ